MGIIIIYLQVFFALFVIGQIINFCLQVNDEVRKEREEAREKGNK